MDNYFDLLPNELILFVIGYVDLSNKSTTISLSKSLEGLISISKRYNLLYDEYINLINNGYNLFF